MSIEDKLEALQALATDPGVVSDSEIVLPEPEHPLFRDILNPEIEWAWRIVELFV